MAKWIIPYSISQQQSQLMKGKIKRVRKAKPVATGSRETTTTNALAGQLQKIANTQMQQTYTPYIRTGITSTAPKPKKAKFKKGDVVMLDRKRGTSYMRQPNGQATVVKYDWGNDSNSMRLAWDGIEDWFNQDDFILVYKAGTAPKPKKVDFDKVFLPDKQKQAILDAIKQIDHHELIFTKWGFADSFEKGTAVSMLFYGPPGTGKTDNRRMWICPISGAIFEADSDEQEQEIKRDKFGNLMHGWKVTQADGGSGG